MSKGRLKALRPLTPRARRHVWDVLRALYLGAAQGLTPAAVAALRTEAFKNPYGPWANDEAGNMADIAEDVAAFTAASHMDALGRQTLLCEVSPAFAAHLHTLPEGEAEGVLRGTVRPQPGVRMAARGAEARTRRDRWRPSRLCSSAC